MIAEFRKGETILLGLDAISGDASMVSDVRAVLKSIGGGGLVAEGTPAAEFIITPRGAGGAGGVGRVVVEEFF